MTIINVVMEAIVVQRIALLINNYKAVPNRSTHTACFTVQLDGAALACHYVVIRASRRVNLRRYHHS